MEETEYYFFIDFLRTIGCCFVILHHCLFYYSTSTLAAFYTANLKYFFPTVPTYLLISGFVHTKKIEQKNQAYSSYVLGNIKRIMIPYFVVSLVTLILQFAVERSHGNNLLNSKAIILRLLFSGVEGHYYFLEMLFLYLLIFPFLLKNLQTTTKALMFFLFILILDMLFAESYMGLKASTWSPLDLLVSILAGFKFFIFGFVLSKFFDLIKPHILKNGAIGSAGLILLYALLHFKFPGGKEYWFMLILFAYFSLALVFFNRPIFFIKQISLLTFGIYLLHQPYFIKLSRLLLSPLNSFPNTMLLSTWVLTTLLTAIAVKLIMKSRFYSSLILGR